MLRIILLLTLSFLLMCSSCAYAIDIIDIGVDLPLSGEAICKFSGNVPVRKIKTLNNSLTNDIVTFSLGISLESEIETNKSSLTASIRASISPFLGTIEGHAGEVLKNGRFQFSILKTTNETEETIEVVSGAKDGQSAPSKGIIKITKIENNKASGELKAVFKKTTETIMSAEKDSKEENGKVIVRCKFKDIPVKSF